MNLEPYHYNEEEMLYIRLEIKKVFDNHKFIPNVFISPIERFVFSGILHVNGTNYRFSMKKETMIAFWLIDLIEHEKVIISPSTGLLESLLYLLELLN